MIKNANAIYIFNTAMEMMIKLPLSLCKHTVFVCILYMQTANKLPKHLLDLYLNNYLPTVNTFGVRHINNALISSQRNHLSDKHLLYPIYSSSVKNTVGQLQLTSA